MIRVLVVDDSAFMRKALSMMLEKDDGITVLATARNGKDAINKVMNLKPDVVTMDVEMPQMDGISAVREIMDRQPLPILMVSSLTKDGAQTTVDALAAGAVDFIAKSSSFVALDIKSIENELIAKVKSVVRSRYFRNRSRRRHNADRQFRKKTDQVTVNARNARLVAIGVSTGGPFALQKVLPELPGDFPVPIAIVQHMPPHFTRSLAERLNNMSALEVVEAEPGMQVCPGRAILAAGGKHLTFRAGVPHPIVRTSTRPTDSPHCPSVDVMFESAHQQFGGDVLALIMSGMGKDGLEGAQKLKDSGARILAQDEATSVVYGMPRAVAEAGLADAVIPLHALPGALTSSIGRRSASRA